MNIYLYYRTYWGDPKSVGMSGRNILAKNKIELVTTTIKSLELNTISKIFTCACVDLSTQAYTNFLEEKFDEVFHTSEGFDVNDHSGYWPIFGTKGNLIKVLNHISSKNHKDNDIILLLEDDYLFDSNGFRKWIEACVSLDGFVSPFDHPDRYYRNDDLFFKKSKIFICNNHHFRNCESTTSVVGGRYYYFRKTHFLRKLPRFHVWFFWPGRIFGKELHSIDRVFYRRAYFFLRVKLFSPIPGFAVHLSQFIPPEKKSTLKKNIVIIPDTQLSPGVDWENRYIDLNTSYK
jgi:hypothetical protein